MNVHHAKRLLIAATLAALASGGIGVAAAAPEGAPQAGSGSASHATPNECIRLNRGDYNACNVGNSGRGDLPYLPVQPRPFMPNDCIRLNGGDYNACDVGNSGRGDLPYLPVH